MIRSMRFPTAVLAALPIFAVAAHAGRDAWSEIGPEGGAIVRVFALPDRAYANHRNGGILVLEDGESGWRRLRRDPHVPASAPPPRLNVVEPAFLIGSDFGRNFFRSLDRGATWKPISPGRNVAAVAYDRTTETLYDVSSPTPAEPLRLRRSADLGDTWQTLGQVNLDVGSDMALLVGGGGHRIYFLQGGCVARSENGGATFDPPPVNCWPWTQMVLDPDDPSRLHAVGSANDFGAYRSTDGGRSFQRIAELEYGDVRALRVDPFDPKHLLVALDRALLESRDRGLSWSEIMVPTGSVSPGFPGFLGADLGARPGEVWAADLLALFRSTDGGTSWSPATDGLNAVEAWDAGFDAEGRLIVATPAGPSHGTFGDGLLTPSTEERPFEVALYLAVAPSDRRVIYAVTDVGHQIARSEDGGATWTLTPTWARGRHFGDLDVVAVDHHDPMTIYAVRDRAIYRSTDGGATAEQVVDSADLGFFPLFLHSVAVSPHDSQTIAIASDFGVATSSDGGATWAVRSDPALTVERVFFDPHNEAHLLATRFGPLMASRDGGATWEEVPVPGMSAPFAVAFDPATPGRIYVGGPGINVARSDDGGGTWRPMSIGIENASVRHLAIDPARSERLVAATAVGAFTFTQVARCTPRPDTLCLDDEAGDGRFEVAVRFQTALGGGLEGDAPSIPLDPLGVDRGGLFHFGNPANPEVLIKVLDGCNNNGHFWIFASAATTLGYDLDIRDLAADTRRIYRNADGQRAETVTDTLGLATCDVASPGAPAAALSATPPTPRRPGMDPTRKVGTCQPSATTLCIDDAPGDRRFAVRLRLDSPVAGLTGDALAIDLDGIGVDRGGLLHFGNPVNPEVLIKILDGCNNNDRFWVFYSAATTLGFVLEVTDSIAGATRTYTNDEGSRAPSESDTQAFATCDP